MEGERKNYMRGRKDKERSKEGRTEEGKINARTNGREPGGRKKESE